MMKHILFIESTLPDYQLLVDGAIANTPIITIAPQQDGVHQIVQQIESASIQESQDLSLHIIAHGAPGCIYLGNSELSLSTIGKYSESLKRLQGKVRQINLYGCNVAAGDAGAEFIEKLHKLTGANIAASSNKVGNAALGGNWKLDVSTYSQKVELPIKAEALASFSSVLAFGPVNEIQKYLIVGLKDDNSTEAVQLSNVELGRDGEVLSTGGTSPSGDVSYPTINSVFDQRWNPSGAEVQLLHPIDMTQLAPFQGVDYTGHIALTSEDGQINYSNVDIFGDLNPFDIAFNDIAIVTENGVDPVAGASGSGTENYFADGAPPNTPTGDLPDNAAGTNGVGFQPGVDLSDLRTELNTWGAGIEAAATEGTITQNIENENYKDGTEPFVIELVPMGGTADPLSDLSFTDTNGDGKVIIDIDLGGNDWEINNSDVIIDGPAGLTAFFRLTDGSNMMMGDNANIGNTSIVLGEGGIKESGRAGAVFYVGEDEGNTGEEVISGSNVVFDGIAFWELDNTTADNGTNTINIQNGQGCAQFIADRVIHSNTRFTACTVECFLTGTRILTNKGEIAVEKLKIGDLVQTAEGKLEPIKWVGRQTFNQDEIKNPLRAYPILIKAGALGNNLPTRNLYVSPDHSMFVDGLLINAGALVNDISIIKTEPTETFTYYHVELENHSLLIAEGTAAESYLPQKENRDEYDNFAEYEVLYPQGSNLMLGPVDYPRISSWNKVPRFVSKKLMNIAHQLTGQDIKLRA